MPIITHGFEQEQKKQLQAKLTKQTTESETRQEYATKITKLKL